MREQTSPDGLTPLTAADLPMAVDGGNAIQSQVNKLSLAPVLAWVGLALAAAGVLILIFGPGSIRVAASGPTLGELLLLHPYALTLLGVATSAAAGYVRRSAWEAIHHYVAARYFLSDDEGRPMINGGLTARPIGGGELEIGYSMNDTSGDPVAPESSR